jgi:hypothetical protein
MVAELSADLPKRGLWRGSDVNGVEDFAMDLDPISASTLEKVAIDLASEEGDVTDATQHDLPLGELEETIEGVQREILEGTGMVLLRGFPVDRLSSREIAYFFWGIGLGLGNAVSQSVMGEKLGRVIDATDVDPHARAYRNRTELTPHTDPSDILAFLCLYPGATGGISHFVSSLTVYEEISENNPEVLEVLQRGFHYHRFGEQEPDCPDITPWRVPVFSAREGKLSCRYVKEFIEIAADENPDAVLSTEEKEALKIFESTAQRQDLRVTFTLQPGELILANNYTVLHARTAFTNHPQRKRELLRLWLTAKPTRPVVKEVFIYERAYNGGEHGIVPQTGQMPSFASRFDQRD